MTDGYDDRLRQAALDAARADDFDPDAEIDPADLIPFNKAIDRLEAIWLDRRRAARQETTR